MLKANSSTKRWEGFEGTPLHWVIGWVFDTELRNSIGHNDYELTQVGEPPRVLRSLLTLRGWRYDRAEEAG